MPPHLLHALDEYLTGYIMASQRELLTGGESAACRRGHWDRWQSGEEKELRIWNKEQSLLTAASADSD